MENEIDTKKEIHDLIRKKNNSFCADCSDSCALYVDMSNGIFICQKCAMIHEQFGFSIKNAAKDNFSVEEIQFLKKEDNQDFNNLWMGLYNCGSSKIPFGASLIERKKFLTDKYINKKWFSSIKSNTFSFDPRRIEIEEYLDDLEQQSPFASSSDQSDFSEISSPAEPTLFGYPAPPCEIEAPYIQQPFNLSNFFDEQSDNDSFCDCDLGQTQPQSLYYQGPNQIQLQSSYQQIQPQPLHQSLYSQMQQQIQARYQPQGLVQQPQGLPPPPAPQAQKISMLSASSQSMAQNQPAGLPPPPPGLMQQPIQSCRMRVSMSVNKRCNTQMASKIKQYKTEKNQFSMYQRNQQVSRASKQNASNPQYNPFSSNNKENDPFLSINPFKQEQKSNPKKS